MNVGVLEFSSRPRHERVSDHLERLMRLAKRADSAGLSHFWMVEHQQPGDSWGCPTVALAAIAAYTKTIRVGAAGVLLRYHNAYSVASEFGLLECMYPGRVDLGIARAAIQYHPNAIALVRGEHLDFEAQLNEVLSLLRAPSTESSPEDAILVPSPEKSPRVWLLGSSETSGRYAARLGLPYAHAMFFSNPDPSGISAYRQAFVPSSYLQRPYVVLALAGLCVRNSARCNELAAAIGQETLRVIGTPAECNRILHGVVTESNVDEISFIHTTSVLDEQIESMEHITQICGAL